MSETSQKGDQCQSCQKGDQCQRAKKVTDVQEPKVVSSSDSSSKSSSSPSSSPAKHKGKKGKKKGKKDDADDSAVQSAKAKSAAQKLDVFAKQAMAEDAKKQKAADKLRAKQIELASSATTKVKKSLVPLKQMMTHPDICHVPEVTLHPLQQAIKQAEHRIGLLERMEKGKDVWNPELMKWSPKDGNSALKLVLAITNTLAKLHKKK